MQPLEHLRSAPTVGTTAEIAYVEAARARMQVVRPDVTRNDATDQALLRHWGVMRPSTLILVGPDGAERRDLRVVGEIDASGFLGRLHAAGLS